MKAKLKYALPLIFTFCFLEAAFEIDTDNIKNTREDEYDIYVPANNSTKLVLAEHTTGVATLPDIVFFQRDHVRGSTAILLPGGTIFLSPPRLYITFCSMLI